MNLNCIYEGAIGTEIVLDTFVDLTLATTIEIRYRKPDGTAGIWAGTLVDLTKVSYTTVADDLDVAGRWVLQVYAETPDWTGLGCSVTMVVLGPFG